MTTDKKQPPEGVLCLVRLAGDKGTDSYTARHNRGKWMLTGYGGVIAANVEDWREMPSWDRLAILDKYDEERKEWTRQVDGLDLRRSLLEEKLENLENDRGDDFNDLAAQVTALTEERSRVLAMLDGRDCAIDEACEERDAAQARADRAEKERDEARASEKTALDDALKLLRERDRAIAERDEALKRNRLGLSAYETVKDCSDWVEAVATALGTYYAYDGPFVAAESTYVVDTIKKDRADKLREVERLEAERDDLGCQLEALRAVQRGDVADLRTRVEAVERWRVEAMREIRR